jgi:cyclopropane-fatty-acyl-phospholipid synthase
MATLAVTPAGVVENVEFFRHFTSVESPCEIALRCWDGTVVPADVNPPAATIVVNHPGSLRQMTWPLNKIAATESYIYGDIDIEGNFEQCFHYLLRVRKQWMARSWADKLGLFRRIVALPKHAVERVDHSVKLQGAERTRGRDAQAVQFHYDGPPSEFFAVCLDRRMQYACAYFDSPDDTIDAAQERKLEHICRKLQLRPGERLMDFGCGWGGLIVYAAKRYGVDATGVTISREQFKWAERWIEREGLGDRCRVIHSDFRDIPEPHLYDKASCIGVIEHLGQTAPTLMSKVHRMLKPGGLFLLHKITRRPFSKYPPWRQFALKYVWPDITLMPIDWYLTELARVGFEIRDVESLREHYIYTLRAWAKKLEAGRTEALKHVDEVTYRIYRAYLAGGALGFRSAWYNLHQTLLVKAGDRESGMPLTRKAWYEPFEPGGA